MASSHRVEKFRQGAKNLAWQAGRSSLHKNSPGLPLLFLAPASIWLCTAAASEAWQKGMCQPRLADSLPGFQPNLQRSPINGALVGVCRQLSISERCANVNASCLLPALPQLKKGKSQAAGGSALSQTRQREERNNAEEFLIPTSLSA